MSTALKRYPLWAEPTDKVTPRVKLEGPLCLSRLARRKRLQRRLQYIESIELIK